MSSRSVIQINKNAKTTVDFNLDISGISDIKKAHATLVIEGVISGCDVSIKATHSKDDVWSVTVPNLNNFKEDSYNVRLEVVVDGYHFVPATGKLQLVDNPVVEIVSEHKVVSDDVEELIEESVNGGDTSMSGPDTSVIDPDIGREEHSIEDKIQDIKTDLDNILRLAGVDRPQPDDEPMEDDIDDETDEADETTIDDIASAVNGVQGPQTKIDDSEKLEPPVSTVNDDVEDRGDRFNVKETAAAIIKRVIPSVSKSTVKGSLISDEVKARLKGDMDAVQMYEDMRAAKEEKNRKIREALNPHTIEPKSTIAKHKTKKQK